MPTTTALGAPPVEVEVERAFARLRDDLGCAMKRRADATSPTGCAPWPSSTRARRTGWAPCTNRRTSSRTSRRGACCSASPARCARGAIWIADRLHAFVALVVVARGASALVANDAVSPVAITIARAAALPVISDVPGLFGWGRPGDLLAVDGERGVVLVQPAPTDIERLRHAREG